MICFLLLAGLSLSLIAIAAGPVNCLFGHRGMMFLPVPPPPETANAGRVRPAPVRSGTRAEAAVAAYRRARWWATRVMGLSFPLVLWETCWVPLSGRGSWALGIGAAVLFCAFFWAFWIGCAVAVAWCRRG